MVGQKYLIKQLTKFNSSTFPKSTMLVGESGSGKKTLINEVICPLLNLQVYNITSNLSLEGIEEIYLSPIPKLYFIDLDELSYKKYNFLLKFLEEPPINSYIILITSRLNSILPTIKSRCIIFTMDTYSDEELATFVGDNKDILNYIRVPGKLLDKSILDNIDNLINFTSSILVKYKQAILSNLLSISSKIDWNNTDNTKFNLDVFIRVFLISAEKAYISKLINLEQFNIIKDFVNGNKTSYSLEKCLIKLKYYDN